MNRASEMLKKKPKRWIVNLIFALVMIAAIVYSFLGSSINWTRLMSIETSLRIMFQGLSDFKYDFLFGTGVYQFEEGVVYMTIVTLAIAFIGTFIGAVLAIPFGFLASENIVGKHVAKIGEAILVIIRVFPEIVLALILVKGFGMNAVTGVLTIGLHSIGMLGKLFAEAIDNMDKSPLEALDAVGANAWQKIRYGIIPQVAADISSITLYRFDINVRSATVLGIVGAGGLGASLILAAENWNWDILGTILLAIVVMVLLVDFVSSYLRSKLV